MLGGKIGVSSKCFTTNNLNENGSLFTFALPCVKMQPDALSHGIKTEKARQKIKNSRRILLVEDDETSVQFMRVLLSEKTTELLIANSGKEAVEQVKNRTDIDVALMDVKMPEMNGFDATRIIKGIAENLPVIAVTEFSYPEDRKKAEEAGCDGFLTKPIQREELFALLDKLD